MSDDGFDHIRIEGAKAALQGELTRIVAGFIPVMTYSGCLSKDEIADEFLKVYTALTAASVTELQAAVKSDREYNGPHTLTGHPSP